MAICEAILNLIYLGVKVSILYIAYLQAEFIKVPEAKGGGGIECSPLWYINLILNLNNDTYVLWKIEQNTIFILLITLKFILRFQQDMDWIAKDRQRFKQMFTVQ